MSTDEIKNLKLGDYVKYSVAQHSDEYYMVTMIGNGYKLRKIGSRAVLTVDSLEDYTKVDTTREN